MEITIVNGQGGFIGHLYGSIKGMGFSADHYIASNIGDVIAFALVFQFSSKAYIFQTSHIHLFKTHYISIVKIV